MFTYVSFSEIDIMLVIHSTFLFFMSFLTRNNSPMTRQRAPTTIYVMERNSFLEPKKLDWDTTKYFSPLHLLTSNSEY